jgi:hypothetical protein
MKEAVAGDREVALELEEYGGNWDSLGEEFGSVGYIFSSFTICALGLKTNCGRARRSCPNTDFNHDPPTFRRLCDVDDNTAYLQYRLPNALLHDHHGSR